MSKVKIVQIALAMAYDGAGGTNERSEYLDDKGRVWYDAGHFERYIDGNGKDVQRWVTVWEQLPLPQEPKS